MTRFRKLTLGLAFLALAALTSAAVAQTQSPPVQGQDVPAERRQELRKNRLNGDKPERAMRACGRKGFHGPKARGLVHSEAKFKTEDGFALRNADHGRVSQVNAENKSIAIVRADGVTVRATAGERVLVCVDGKRAEFDAIEVGMVARLMQGGPEGEISLKGVFASSGSSDESANASAQVQGTISI